MRVLSLNAWGGRLHDRLVPYLAATDPDILCLQEVTRSPNTQSDWLIYRDGDKALWQRADLFREVAEVLPGHQAFFCPAACGDLFDDETPVASEWGLATFVRRSFPVIGQMQDFVHGAFAPDGWGGHPRARNAHAVRVFDYEARRAVVIAHTHGLRDPAGKHDTPARRTQAEALAGLVAHTRHDGDHLVVCGDFNVLPGSVTFDVLGKLSLSDLVTKHGYTDTRTSHYEKTPRYADYMLISDAVTVCRFEVVEEPEVSDHRPLMLEMG
ncbi:endonuclease/exonuclease/phosphatase family protein [Mesorhizobium xinjiangense]|uniref:endonuclease/exonuclease/phosphatase family protein n=1 Tax=Mesorhizobium xinjiangense TaxID=2678685 RepID=UPI0012EE9A0F|nr:endonuclease/exonuclease/phosphatase family protein [Mesorhizobium xinjiangense]